jgi:hypothetical protein
MSYVSWLHAAVIRMVRTAAQAALGVIGTSAVVGDVSWDIVIGTTVLAMVVSMLMSLAGLPETQESAPLERGDGGQANVALILLLVVIVALFFALF